MRFDLKVPFAEKDAAKQLGARWDAASKVWYVIGKDDMSPFAKWSPSPRDSSTPSAPPASAARPRPTAAPATAATAKVHVGSNYVERARVCDCLPWEACARCEGALPA